MNTHGRTRMAAEWSRFEPVSCVFMWKVCLPLTAGDLATDRSCRRRPRRHDLHEWARAV